MSRWTSWLRISRDPPTKKFSVADIMLPDHLLLRVVGRENHTPCGQHWDVDPFLWWMCWVPRAFRRPTASVRFACEHRLTLWSNNTIVAMEYVGHISWRGPCSPDGTILYNDSALRHLPDHLAPVTLCSLASEVLDLCEVCRTLSASKVHLHQHVSIREALTKPGHMVLVIPRRTPYRILVLRR